jgi:predicted nucleic acid-binding protein
MATDLFVDTSGFYASLSSHDDMHADAAELLASAARKRQRLLTTDYVLDETVTLLRVRGCGHLVEPLLSRVMESRACRVEWMDAQRFRKVRQFMAVHADKAWSFTDCFSFVVMKDAGIRSALTKDGHFRQAGFEVLPG